MTLRHFKSMITLLIYFINDIEKILKVVNYIFFFYVDLARILTKSTIFILNPNFKCILVDLIFMKLGIKIENMLYMIW